jgi:hypothetical protein
MNALACLDDESVRKVVLEYVYRVLNIGSLIDDYESRNSGRDTKIIVFGKIYAKPGMSSIARIIEGLIRMDVSHSVMHWVLASIDYLLEIKAIGYDAYTLCFSATSSNSFTPMLHTIQCVTHQLPAYLTKELWNLRWECYY